MAGVPQRWVCECISCARERCRCGDLLGHLPRLRTPEREPELESVCQERERAKYKWCRLHGSQPQLWGAWGPGGQGTGAVGSHAPPPALVQRAVKGLPQEEGKAWT